MTAQIGMRPSATTEGNFPGSLQTGKFLDGSRVLMRCVTLVLAFIIAVLFCLFVRPGLMCRSGCPVLPV